MIRIQWPPPPKVETSSDSPATADTWIPIPLTELLRRLETREIGASSTRKPTATALAVSATLVAGLAAGGHWFAFRQAAAAILDPSPGSTMMLAVVALLAATVGSWLPVRFLPSAARFVERHREGTPSGPSGPPSLLSRVLHQRDETLFWAAAAILSAVTAIEVLVLLAATSAASTAYRGLLSRFFWTDATLAAVEWLGTALLLGPLWILHALIVLGILLAAARRQELRQALITSMGAWIAGFGVAATLHPWMTDRGISSDQQVILGMAPLFVAAVLLCVLAHDAESRHLTHELALRTLSGARESDSRWVRLSLPAMGLGAGLAALGLLACRDCAGGRGTLFDVLSVGCAAIGFALAAVLRERFTRGCLLRGSASGMAVWAAGAGAGVAATLAARVPADWSVLAQAMLFAAPAGIALCDGLTAWATPSTGRGPALARMSRVLFGALAASLVVGHWILMPVVGPAGVLAAGALAMLTFGGLAQIYADDQPSRSRYLRLALVFASLAGAIAVFPGNVRRWTGLAREQRVPCVDASWLAQHAPPGARRIWLIDADLAPGRCAVAPWDPPRRVRLSLSYPLSREGLIAGPRDRREVDENVYRALRLEHAPCDLIYQHGPLASVNDRFPGYALEWLTALARHRAPGGRVIVDVPLGGLSTGSARVIAATFEQALGPACWYSEVSSPAGPVLRLRSALEGPFEPDRPADEGWQPLEPPDGAVPAGLHSLRRDRITGTLPRRHP